LRGSLLQAFFSMRSERQLMCHCFTLAMTAYKLTRTPKLLGSGTA
jgi:hypothetical protein